MQTHIHPSIHPSQHAGWSLGPLQADRSPASDFWEMPELPLCVFFFSPSLPLAEMMLLSCTSSATCSPKWKQPHDPSNYGTECFERLTPAFCLVTKEQSWTWTQRLHCPQARRDGCWEEFERHRFQYICCFSMKLYTLLQIISCFLSMFQHFELKLKSP